MLFRSKDPRNVKHRFEMAHYYFTHKNYGSMIEFCNGLITEIVGSPPPEISLEATLKEKNNEIPVNSDSLDDCQVNLVFYMYSFGHFLEAAYPVALEGIDTFLSRAPENWQGWLLKTLIHFRQSSENEADEAIEAFQEACLLNRDITVVIESLLDLKTPVLLEDVMYWLASFRCSGNQSSK